MRLILLTVLFLSCSINTSFAWSIEPVNEEPVLNSRIKLVFCPLNYFNKKSFSKDIGIILERLKTTRPFDEFVNTFGIWQINIVEDEEKILFKKAQSLPPLKVRQDFLDGIRNKLKSEYKLIIIDARGSVSCAELSSIDKMSLVILGKARYKDSQSFAKGFLHELGHSLGLRDECIDCGRLCPPGEPNCARTEAEAKAWWGDLVGKVPRVNYIRGCCGNKNYIRPVIASLMNDPDKAEDFGPVNERFLRKELEK